MAIYIQLLTLTLEGRAKMLADPELLLRAQDEIAIPGVQMLGQYGVLGDYDFVCILEAPDNDSAARFSLELGVKAGAHIATLPAIPLGRFEAVLRETSPEPELVERQLRPPADG